MRYVFCNWFFIHDDNFKRLETINCLFESPWIIVSNLIVNICIYIYIYTSGTHAQAHTRLKIAIEQHRMMEMGVGSGGGWGGVKLWKKRCGAIGMGNGKIVWKNLKKKLKHNSEKYLKYEFEARPSGRSLKNEM